MKDKTENHKIRCGWLSDDLLMTRYHDTEWGVPVKSDTRHFEFLVLGGAQAGLSWLTILKRREGYRKAFEGFRPERVAKYTPHKIALLLKDPGIIRNRLKVESAVNNAKAFLKVREEFGSFNSFIWDFVDGSPVHNRRRSVKELPARTPLSDRISQELKGRGFTFAGTLICYAFIQTIGMVNDHTIRCFRHAQIRRGNC